MFEFTIENEKYRIEHNDLDDLIVFTQYSESESKWKWKQVLESYDIGEGKIYADVKTFMDKFLSMVNKTLEENHGKVDSGTEFKNHIEELKYRIDNNLEIKDNKLTLIEW